MGEIRKALPPLYPFNDDEVAADPQGYRDFLANGAIGADKRQRERQRDLLNRAKKRARRRA